MPGVKGSRRSSPGRVRLFRADVAATFVERPNRYLVRARVGRRFVDAYCPNPGRLAELLLPGCELILERAGGERTTRYTLVACRHPRSRLVVPLYATRSNQLARDLVIPELFPKALAVQPEVRLGASRIDFRIDLPRGKRAYVEVKTCTLVEHGVAMFPDAPTTRGLRHLTELAAVGGHALFVLMSPGARCMVPNVHTDPAFAFGLLAAERRVGLHAVAVRTTPSGWARLERSGVPVELEPIRRLEEVGYSAASVGGAYLLAMVLRRPRSVEVGGLGRIELPAGGYVYVGSALRGLGPRVARHLRRRKTLRWHVDYLTRVVDICEAFPIVSARRLECDLARDVEVLSGAGVRGFGCSDCSCDSHLFRLPEDPRRVPAFVELVARYRHVVALAP